MMTEMLQTCNEEAKLVDHDEANANPVLIYMTYVWFTNCICANKQPSESMTKICNWQVETPHCFILPM